MGGKTKQDATVQIRDRAYALWEREGYPVGRDVEFWLTAEAQITKEINGSKPATARRAPRATAKATTTAKKAPTSQAKTRKSTKKAARTKRNGK